MEESDHGTAGQVDRRTVLRRAAVTGGALVWTAPVVQSLASPAFAAGSPLCDVRVDTGDCVITYQDSPDCCACIESHSDLSLPDAVAACAADGVCAELTRVCGEQDRDHPPPERHPDRQPASTDVPTVIPAGE